MGERGGLDPVRRMLKEYRFKLAQNILNDTRKSQAETVDPAERARLQKTIDQLETELERLAIELE